LYINQTKVIWKMSNK